MTTEEICAEQDALVLKAAIAMSIAMLDITRASISHRLRGKTQRRLVYEASIRLMKRGLVAVDGPRMKAGEELLVVTRAGFAEAGIEPPMEMAG